MSSHNRGFTIVELLVVIVIIGILASLVIVSYRGSQQKASNTQTLNTVTHYIKATFLYELENKKFPEPSPGGVAWSCLGTGYPGNVCLTVSGGACNGFGGVTSANWYNDAVMPHLGNKTPPTSLQRISCNGSTVVGGAFLSNWPAEGQAGIFYQLNSNVNCGSPGGKKGAPWFNADNNSPMCYLVLDK